MEFNIEPGLTLEAHYKVEDRHIADFLGSGAVSVLSTPSMILFMELTAKDCAQQALPEGWVTVGTHVDIYHTAAAKKGAEITIITKLKTVDRKKLIFEVKALDGDKEIGKGTHDRFIVNQEKFMANI